MKKGLSQILVLVLLVLLIPVGLLSTTASAETSEVWAVGICGENVEWTLYEDGLLVISGEGAMTTYGSTSAPWYSKYRTKITAVEIGSGVTSISRYAFNDCTSLTSVTIPDSVTSIGVSAFSGCSSLTSFSVAEENTAYTAVDGVLFSKDMKTLVAYPAGKTDSAYVIPDSVTTISGSAFSGCTNLTGFSVAEGNSAYTVVDGVLFSKDMKKLVIYPSGKTDSTYVIPEGITSIRDNAFYGCSSLTSVTIPESVTYIGVYAFYGCSSLTSVAIPAGVISINGYAFQGCSGLTSVTIPDGVISICSDAFRACSSLTSVTIPDSVTSIGSSAFYGCSSLTSVTIPDSVTTIGYGAFNGCSSLTSVTIPDSVTTIDSGTFSGCTSLTSITIGTGVTSIGDSAFDNCSSLTSVTIPDSVTTIGYSAFRGCSSLTSVTIPDSVTTIGSYAFYGCSSLTDVYYGGTETQKAAMTIGSSNAPLNNATWHYPIVTVIGSSGETWFDTLAEALAAAGSGDTVRLYTNLTESIVAIENAATTLDLNGHTLTVGKYLLSTGNVIDSSDGEGLLLMDPVFCILPETNAQMPLYDAAAGGYRLFTYAVTSQSNTKLSGDKITFGVRVNFTNPEAYELLRDPETAGFRFGLQIHWTGLLAPMQYYYAADIVTIYAENCAANPQKNYVFTMTLSGYTRLAPGSTITVLPSVVSDLGVTGTGAEMSYTIPSAEVEGNIVEENI